MTLHNTASSSEMVTAGSGTRSSEWWPVGSGQRGARCVINPTDSKARFPALSKLSTGCRTLMYGNVVIEHVHTHCISIRRRMQHAARMSLYAHVRARRMRCFTQCEWALRHRTSPYIDAHRPTATQVAVPYIHVQNVSTSGAVRKADAGNARTKTCL